MKKTLAVAVGLAATLSLTGCSLFSSNVSDSKPSQSHTAEARDTSSAEIRTTPSPSPSSSESPAPSESPTTTDEPVGSSYTPADFMKGSMPDNQYVSLVRKNTTAMSDVSDDAILLVAGKACSSLGNGESFSELLQGAADSIQASIDMKTGSPATYTSAIGADAGFIIGSGVKVYCPQYEETLKAAVPSN